ncbi:NlpC/P60 family protein [Streptomyces sp. NPDC014889]|uniref:C40 family peptidase n=1 Tax=Streptomyces sp. NPDC014889 TaxID=3364928 RepID=UPI0036FC0387
MASHSNTRPAAASGPGTRGADGAGPSPEEVERKLDYLYGRAGSSTARKGAAEKGGAEKDSAEKGGAQKKGARQRGLVAALLDDVARRTDMLGRAREMLGSFAAAPNRNGDGTPETAALLLTETPQGYFDQAQLISRLNARRESLADGPGAQPPAPGTTVTATPAPTEPQHDIAAAKAAVQRKLAHARVLLSAHHAHEAMPATEPAPRPQTAKNAQNPTASPPQDDVAAPGAPTGVFPGQTADVFPGQAADVSPGQTPGLPPEQAPGTPTGQTPSIPMPPEQAAGVFPRQAFGFAVASRADQALAFAREQIGKPYVWGAAGPGSYDCSGLTQAAWKAAGVTLPRAARDQAQAGTAVPLSEARPGDLVFFAFFEDAEHVGLYAGEGVLIHAPRPGDRVREEPVHHDGASAVRRVVRPA